MGILTFFSTIYIVGLFTQKLEFPVFVGRSDITVAIAGAAIGGYILAMIMNVLGIRFVNGAYRRFNDQSVTAIRGILRRIDIILGAIGAISGTGIAFVVELIAGEKLGGVAKGAVLGATTGIASGAIAAIAVAIIQNITVPAITKMCTDREIKVIIVNATIGAFIGGIFGGYFTSNIVAGSLVALAFPTVTPVIYTALLYAERRHRFKRMRRVPLTRVMNTFGIELRYLTSEETQNN